MAALAHNPAEIAQENEERARMTNADFILSHKKETPSLSSAISDIQVTIQEYLKSEAETSNERNVDEYGQEVTNPNPDLQGNLYKTRSQKKKGSITGVLMAIKVGMLLAPPEYKDQATFEKVTSRINKMINPQEKVSGEEEKRTESQATVSEVTDEGHQLMLAYAEYGAQLASLAKKHIEKEQITEEDIQQYNELHQIVLKQLENMEKTEIPQPKPQ